MEANEQTAPEREGNAREYTGIAQANGARSLIDKPHDEAEQLPLLDAAEELAAAKASPDGAWLSPDAQALYEAEGAIRFAKYHPISRAGRAYIPEFKEDTDVR